MRKQFLAVAVASGLIAIAGTVGTASAAGDPPGNAYGYWAGRLCDHTGPDHNNPFVPAGTTYWESRGYADRGTCVSLEGQSLKAGGWSLADWPEI